jgi:hypothetical protein
MEKRSKMTKQSLILAVTLATMVGQHAYGQSSAEESKVSVANPAPAQRVALVSDACPVVHQGDILTLDWNPGFDQNWAVVALSSVMLNFTPLDENGITVRPSAGVLFRGNSLAIDGAPSINGYFHVEIHIAGRIAPGKYNLRSARMNPKLAPDFDGPPPVMTVSPARERFCITVVPRAQTQSPPSS